PFRIPDPRPESRVQLWMVAGNAHWFDFPTQESLGNGLSIDRHIHGLPHPFVGEGDLGVELFWGGKIEAPEAPIVLHGMQGAGADLHAFGDCIGLSVTVYVRDVHLFR